jgi:hypothetical protein
MKKKSVSLSEILRCKTLTTLLSIFVMFTPAISKISAAGAALEVRGEKLFFNNREIKLIGLRCSNALVSDQSTTDLVRSLDTYRSFGVNAISVFFMGSRFGDVKGYLPDGSLNPLIRDRMARLLQATAERDMIMIVGCLYWGTSRAKEDLTGWTQESADRAVGATARWLAEEGFTHVILDPDNEGMATAAMKWNVEPMIRSAKVQYPGLIVANNTRQTPDNEDLNMHFGQREPGKPWFDSEATPNNAPGGYWSRFSKETHQADSSYWNYSRIGRYTNEMKEDQKRQTLEGLTRFNGYIFAGTWLQCGRAEGIHGPFTRPGGHSRLGSNQNSDAPWNTNIDIIHPDAGILWWLEFVRDEGLGQSVPEGL